MPRDFASSLLPLFLAAAATCALAAPAAAEPQLKTLNIINTTGDALGIHVDTVLPFVVGVDVYAGGAAKPERKLATLNTLNESIALPTTSKNFLLVFSYNKAVDIPLEKPVEFRIGLARAPKAAGPLPADMTWDQMSFKYRATQDGQCIDEEFFFMNGKLSAVGSYQFDVATRTMTLNK